MTHPEPVVTDSGVPEVEQDVDTWTDPEEGSGSMFFAAGGRLVNPEAAPNFEQEVARHHARLDAERVSSRPVTPAEERTGVSDVQHAVREEVAAVRRLATAYGLACEDFGANREAMFSPGRNAAQRSMRIVKADLAAALDRIEQLARGGQR